MYRYFPDKRAFFAAVVKDEADRLRGHPKPAADRPDHVRRNPDRACWGTWLMTNSTRRPRGPPTSASAGPTRFCSVSTTKPRTARWNTSGPRRRGRGRHSVRGAGAGSRTGPARVLQRLAGVHLRDLPTADHRPDAKAERLADACAHALLDHSPRARYSAELAQAMATALQYPRSNSSLRDGHGSYLSVPIGTMAR